MTPYGSIPSATAYYEAMGYEVPAGDVGTAILRGSVYIDGVYGDRFSGLPTDPDQDRAWPRTGASAFGSSLASNVIPKRVEHAAYEAALVELREPGSLSLIVSGSARVVREKVGELEVQYANPGSDAVLDAQPVLTVVEGLLAPLLTKPMPGILVV